MPPPTRPVDPALAADPALLAEQVGLELDGWQRDVLRSTARQVILLCSRQSGKSTVTALLALHTALYTPGALVLLLSPSLRQSQELYLKVKAAYDRLGRPVPAAKETELQLHLANGSRIVALPGTEATVRGYSGAALLVCDEDARVPDELYHAVRPMLAVSGGRLLLLSTPWGKRGHFFAEWTGGVGWERVRVTAHECPRISPEFLEAERASLPAHVFASEYECTFGETLGSVFGHEDVRAALDPAVKPLFGAPLFGSARRAG